MIENGDSRIWFIQAKRVSRIAGIGLRAIVDEALSKTEQPPTVLLAIVAADVSKKAHESFAQYAAQRGIGQPNLWPRSLIEARLYSERPDLLFAYFGISTSGRQRGRETTVRRNIALKRNLRRDFRKPAKDQKRGVPYGQFAYGAVIVRSIDDSAYPDVDESPGISSWFKAETYDFYFNGLEVILNIQYVLSRRDGSWSPIEYERPYSSADGLLVKCFVIGRIPYRLIVDYDLEGDEYYQEPQLFCIFGEAGEPYEGIRYYSVDEPYLQRFDPGRLRPLPTWDEKREPRTSKGWHFEADG